MRLTTSIKGELVKSYIIIGKISKKGQPFSVYIDANTKAEAQEKFIEGYPFASVLEIKEE